MGRLIGLNKMLISEIDSVILQVGCCLKIIAYKQNQNYSLAPKYFIIPNNVIY